MMILEITEKEFQGIHLLTVGGWVEAGDRVVNLRLE